MRRYFAPGRVELLGNHTDYNDGTVLSAAIDRGVTVEAAISDDGAIYLESEGFGGRTVCSGEALVRHKDWTDYVLGVVDVFRRAGHAVGGFKATYSSNLPVGAGLSSSAALEVSTAVMLRDLFQIEIDRLALAKLCRRAENEFVGVNCGLLDQASSVFGRAGHVVHLDCRSETITNFPFPEGVELLIINSGASHTLTGGEYNERRDQCFEAARLMGAPALRDVSSEQLAAAELPDIVKRRAAHVVGEIERVALGVDRLQQGDVGGFGQLLSASHRSSMENFENSTPELDALVESALLQDNVLGSRLTGGGFGGATVSLVRSAGAEDARIAILDEYHARTGIHAESISCQIGDGADWV